MNLLKHIIWLVPLTLIIVIACTDPKDVYEGPMLSKYSVTYEIVKDFKAVEDRYNELWIESGADERSKEDLTIGEMKAFSYTLGNKCYIVMTEPQKYSLRELEITIGHEHIHCMFGIWHGTGGQRSYPSRLKRL